MYNTANTNVPNYMKHGYILTWSWASSIHLQSSHVITLRSVLILFSRVLGLEMGCFIENSPVLCNHSLYCIQATRQDHHSPLYFSTLTDQRDLLNQKVLCLVAYFILGYKYFPEHFLFKQNIICFPSYWKTPTPIHVECGEEFVEPTFLLQIFLVLQIY
jgi:hypothetical protein